LEVIAMMAGSQADEGRTFHGLTFPEAIDGTVYRGALDNETERPGLGYTVGYSRPGLEATVHIYDRGLSVIPNDIGSKPLLDEFERAKAEVLLAYANAEPDRQFDIRRADGQTMWCATCTIPSRVHDADRDDSFLAVTAWNDKFVKFRVTANQTDTSELDVQRFVAAWASVLWPFHN
jgi:hypothetical protein